MISSLLRDGKGKSEIKLINEDETEEEMENKLTDVLILRILESH